MDIVDKPHALAAMLLLMANDVTGCRDHTLGVVTNTDHATTPLPALIAHRSGTYDFPENTLVAIDGALANHAEGIWLSVQLSLDGVPVLYRPQDLSALTDHGGAVASMTADELAHVNAGWHFQPMENVLTYPYRTNPIGIPTLEQALSRIPHDIPVVLDMKALPAAAQAAAVARVLDRQVAWSRVTIYSTAADYQAEFARYPKARAFESRDATRQRLFGLALTGKCDVPVTGTRAGFELVRTVEIVERFSLGSGRSNIDAITWTPASLRCFHTAPNVTVYAFAVNDAAAYREAACLGIHAVLVDSPKKMYHEKMSLPVPLDCSDEAHDTFRMHAQEAHF